jgi:hypothetical protein
MNDYTRTKPPAKTRTTREAKLRTKIDGLLAEHHGAVNQRLEQADTLVLNKIANSLKMPRHVRSALYWAMTSKWYLSPNHFENERVLRSKAYDMAIVWIHRAVNATTTNQAERARYERMMKINEGACAGYLFAAKEQGYGT